MPLMKLFLIYGTRMTPKIKYIIGEVLIKHNTIVADNIMQVGQVKSDEVTMAAGICRHRHLERFN